MSVTLTGDFARLKALQQRIGKTGDASFRRELLQQLAEESRYQVHQSFEQGRSPFGERWLPLKYRRGQPLRDTRRLENSITTSVSSRRFSVGTNVRYARIHNRGGNVRRKARVMAHDADSGALIEQSLKSTRRLAVRTQFTGAVRVSFAKAHGITIPQRQFLPEGELPPKWARAYVRIADAYMRLHMEGV